MSNNIFLHISKLGVKNIMLNILIDFRIIFLFRPLLLKGLYKDPINIRQLFWGVKIEHWYFQKNTKHKMGTYFTPQLKILSKIKLIRYAIKKVNCVLEYYKLKIIQKFVDKFGCPFCGALKREYA